MNKQNTFRKEQIMRYVALLRGINVGGKNKVPMKELKAIFENLGFTEVITYINSGNVIFSSESKDKEKLIEHIKTEIKDTFQLDIPVYLTTIDELTLILENAPDWWGSKEKKTYDNGIFIIPPTTYQDVFNEIGEVNPNYEKIDHYQEIIYWTFELKSYSKTNWIKTASSSINDKVTIRTANTIRKLIELGKSK